MRVDASLDEHAFRFRFIDARTGLSLPFTGIVWADDVTHEIGVVSVAKLLDDGLISVAAVKVPKVVIDLERDTILINVGDVEPVVAVERREEATA